MSVAPDRAEAHARDLARFQAIAMHAAEKAHAAIEACEDAGQLCGLVAAVNTAGRALRMSIALEAKLARDAAREARAAADHAEAQRGRTVEVRKAQVRHAVDPLIWTEHGYADAEFASEVFEERLEHEALDPRFTEEPVEAQIERIRGILGLTGEGDRPYYPRKLRHKLRFGRPIGPLAEGYDFDDLDDFGDDFDDEDDDEADPDPDPAPERPERLAPPMDVPPWLDDTS